MCLRYEPLVGGDEVGWCRRRFDFVVCLCCFFGRSPHPFHLCVTLWQKHTTTINLDMVLPVWAMRWNSIVRNVPPRDEIRFHLVIYFYRLFFGRRGTWCPPIVWSCRFMTINFVLYQTLASLILARLVVKSVSPWGKCVVDLVVSYLLWVITAVVLRVKSVMPR